MILKMLKKGTILLTTRAPIGKVALVENLNYPTTINPQLTVFKNIKIKEVKQF